mgnify:FL=1
MDSKNSTIKIERAISELRRGGKIVISDNNTGVSIVLFAAELIEKGTIEEISQSTLSRPSIILSSNRASAIGIRINNQPCSISVQRNWTETDILSLCMPLIDHPKPKINGVISENNKIVSSCLLILRQARLLPAGLMSIISNVSLDDINHWSFKNDLINIDANDIQFYETSNSNKLTMSVKAKVPISYTDNCEIVIFRPKDGGDEHFCLIFGKTRNVNNDINHDCNNTLVRIHSQCITGDILESLKCDCGQQLKESIKLMANANEGLLIYLAQEGRDIGLLNKLRAYSLQENGMDTVEANEALGFNDDERLYYPAKEILSQFKINKVRLITNNPKKVEHMLNLGISVTERIPIKIDANKHNKKYLETKSKKSGHFL